MPEPATNQAILVRHEYLDCHVFTSPDLPDFLVTSRDPVPEAAREVVRQLEAALVIGSRRRARVEFHGTEDRLVDLVESSARSGRIVSLLFNVDASRRRRRRARQDPTKLSGVALPQISLASTTP